MRKTTEHAVEEDADVYHEPAAPTLSNAGVTVSIANPAQVRDFDRSVGGLNRTDGVDSLVLTNNPRLWTPRRCEARIVDQR